MHASEFFEQDRVWLERQPNMNDYESGCAKLLQQMDEWTAAYTRALCATAAVPGSPAHEAYRRRLWYCWGFHWQPNWTTNRKYRRIDGGRIARQIEDWPEGGNLIRDVTLAEAATQKEDRALGILHQEYADSMTRMAMKVSRRFAEDAWNNVFGESFGEKGRLANYQGQRPLASYLATIVTREVLRLIKRWKYETTGTSTESDGTQEDDDAAARRECEALLEDVLREVIPRIEPEERLLLVCRYIAAMTVDEIGLLLGIDKGNVSRRLQRLLGRLRALIEVVVRDRKQTESVANCVELMFQDLLTAELGAALIRVLEEFHDAPEDTQGGGTQT